MLGYVRPAAVVALAILGSSVVFGQASNLSITNYQFVSEQRATLTASDVTYRADLVNTGGAFGSVTATVTSLDPFSVRIVPGQDTLHFAPVPAHSQVTSSNTFTILVDRSLPFDFSKLQWSFDTTAAPPVANAGPNQTVAVGSTVTLDGSGSTNPSGIGTLMYSWQLTSRPAGATSVLMNINSVMPTFVADAPGTYTIMLTVSNGVASSSATVMVSTGRTPPVANAGPDQTVALGSTVVLNGGTSTSVDGRPLTYAWTLTMRPAGSAAALNGANTVSPTFVADVRGTYMAQLIVNDGLPSNPSTVTITTSAIVKPVANPGLPQLVNIGSVVQLSGAGSTDANGLPLTYLWSLNSLPVGSSAMLSNPNIVNPTFIADRPGTYVAQLIVNNGTFSSDPATVMITTQPPLPPAANAGPNQTVNVGTTVQLNGSGTDPQNLPLTFQWSLSKPAGSAAVLSSTVIPNPTFVADIAGTYVAQLIVNNGSKSSAPSTVMISTTCSQPTANPGPNQNVGIGATVTLNGSASGDACHDPLTYAWTFTTRPPGSAATLSGANTVSPSFVADVAGMYVVQLIVDNGFAKSNPVTVTITAAADIILPTNVTVMPGQQVNFPVTLAKPAPAGGIFISLVSSDTSKVTVLPVNVFIPEGGTVSNQSKVTGVDVGSATITASASGLQPASSVVQVSLGGVINVPATTSVLLGQSTTFAINLSQAAPAGGLTVNLVSSDNSKVTVSPSVTILAGATAPAVQPQVTGVGVGSATITASGSGYTSGSGTVTVPPPTISFAGSPLALTTGSTQNLTLNLAGGTVPAGGLTINLASDNTAVATVPATVTFAAGATSVQVPVTGVGMGTANITASAPGIISAVAIVNVTNLVINVPANTTVMLGLSAPFAVTLSQPAAANVTITLTSSDSSKVTVSPASVTILAGATAPATQPQVTGAGVGSATITASAPGYTSGTGIVTVPPPTLSFAGDVSLTVGNTGNLTLNMTGGQAPVGGLTINLVSSDPTKATVPATVMFAAGATSVQVPVTGVAMGSSTITASAPGIASASATANVVSLLINVPANTSVLLGQSTTFTVTLSQPAAANVTVNLTSSDTSKVTVSPSVTILAGATTPATQPQVTGAGVGSAVITASASGYTSGTGTVTVPPPTMSFTGSPLTLIVGATQNLTLNLAGGQAPATGLTINLVSSDPTKATVPATVMFAAGATTVNVPVTGVAAGGPVTITASAPGIANATATVNVVVLSIGVPANTTLTLGQTATFAVTLSQPAAADVTVALSSSDNSKVTISPASVIIPAGATTPAAQPQVTGAGVGAAVITASASGYTSGTGTVTVTPPTLSFTGSLSLSVGGTGNLTLNLAGGTAPAGGLTINLVSSDTTKATVPATVMFAAGMNTVNVPVTAVGGGSATITASAPGIAAVMATVNVATLSIGVPPTTSVLLGQSAAFPVTLSGPAPANLTITLTSSDNSKVTVSPATVTILAGATTPAMQPQVTGVGVGSVTVTASSPGYLSGTGTVSVPPPTISFAGNLAINGGTTGNLTLNLAGGTAPAGGLTINLISSDPSIATVPATVTFAPGTNSVMVPVMGVTVMATSMATITASAPGIAPASATVTVLIAGSMISVPNVAVGQNLQRIITVNLSPNVPATGCDLIPNTFCLIVTSSDPNIAVVSGRQGDPGTQQLRIPMSQGLNAASFFIQGINIGTATLTVSGQGYPNGTGTITVTPSGFVMTGPGGVASFMTNVGAAPSTLTINAARLDSSFHFAEIQQIRGGYAASNGGLPASVNVTNSNPGLGTVTSPVAFPDASDTATTTFTPSNNNANTGTATLMALPASPGFSTPAAGNTVNVTVSAQTLVPANVTVGRNLETTAHISGGASGLSVTITSNNPSLVQFACVSNDHNSCIGTTPNGPGAPSIILSIPGGGTVTPDFYVYGLASSGTATYSATAPGFVMGTGTVTLGPSGFVIGGPAGFGGSFVAISTDTPVTVSSVLLDSSGNIVAQQAVAGGLSVDVTVSSSNTNEGTISTSPVTFTGGSFTATTMFHKTPFAPAGTSDLTVNTPATPPGFSTPASQFTKVQAIILGSGISLSCDGTPPNQPPFLVGQNLQAACTASMSNPAPAGGLQVTLMSNSASLLLAGAATDAGGGTIMVTIPGGATSAPYYVQALASTGTATYTGSANGLTPKTATITFAPSGVVIAGPFGLGVPFFSASVSGGPVLIQVYTAVLNAGTNTFASNQALRGGFGPLAVSLSSNPAIGKVPATLTIQPGADHADGQFTPVSQGQTSVTLTTPAGFIGSSNQTTVLAQVSP